MRPRNGRTRKLTRPIQVGHVGSRISKIWISSSSLTPFSGCCSEKWKKWLILWGGKGVIFELTAAHVPDVLEQNPSGFELYSPKSRFLSGRQRHLFKLIDPNNHILLTVGHFSRWKFLSNLIQSVLFLYLRHPTLAHEEKFTFQIFGACKRQKRQTDTKWLKPKVLGRVLR